MRAEEGLLGAKEVDAAQVADERPRLGAAAQVEGDGDADERDPDDLEAVSEPPAEVPVVEQERGDERGGQPDDADGDDQVGGAAREPVRALRTQAEEPVEDEPRGQDRERERAARLRDARHEARLEQRGGAEAQHGREEREQRPDGVGPAQRGQRGEGEDGASDRQRGAAGEGDDAVAADDDAGRRQAVQAEERGHHREGGPTTTARPSRRRTPATVRGAAAAAASAAEAPTPPK